MEQFAIFIVLIKVTADSLAHLPFAMTANAQGIPGYSDRENKAGRFRVPLHRRGRGIGSCAACGAA